MARYSTEELRRIVEEAGRDERREMVEREVAKRLKKMTPRPEAPPSPRLTRSTMSAKEISDFIDEHGLEKFRALPRE